MIIGSTSVVLESFLASVRLFVDGLTLAFSTVALSCRMLISGNKKINSCQSPGNDNVDTCRNLLASLTHPLSSYYYFFLFSLSLLIH